MENRTKRALTWDGLQVQKKKEKHGHKGNKKKNNQINQRLLKRKTKKAKKGMQRTYQGACNPH